VDDKFIGFVLVSVAKDHRWPRCVVLGSKSETGKMLRIWDLVVASTFLPKQDRRFLEIGNLTRKATEIIKDGFDRCRLRNSGVTTKN
jgi:hypothetical protein